MDLKWINRGDATSTQDILKLIAQRTVGVAREYIDGWTTTAGAKKDFEEVAEYATKCGIPYSVDLQMTMAELAKGYGQASEWESSSMDC